MATESTEVDSDAKSATADPDSTVVTDISATGSTETGDPESRSDGPTVFIPAGSLTGDPVLGPLPDPPPAPDLAPGADLEPQNPGESLGRGRYRLLDQLGRDDRCGAVFWRGRDAVLERDVALTVFSTDPGDAARLGTIRAMMQRALRSARLDSAGSARVLDVLEPEPGSGATVAAVVAEWTPGHALLDEVTGQLPAPATVAGMLAPLAGAVDDAHRHGLVLGCDDPHRIRITPDGQARLAFHAPPVETGTSDDVQGLGAALYLLLSGHWPLPGGPAGVPQAPLADNNLLVSPRALRPEVPLELSTLALRCLAGAGSAGVHTGAAVARVLERNTAESTRGVDVAGENPQIDGWRSPELDPEEPRRRRLKLSVGVGVLIAGSLAILGWLGMQVASVFGGGDSGGPPLVIGTATPGAGTPAGPSATPLGSPVQVSTVRVYDVSASGSPDNADQVRRAIDGDPATSWSTAAYRQPFPAFKPGIGLMLTLPEAVAPASVTVASPSPGTVLEIRAATAPNAPLAQTRLIGNATLTGPETVINLQGGAPTRYLLVWITTLSGAENRSELGEITIRASR